jgi:hypothetical protein
MKAKLFSRCSLAIALMVASSGCSWKFIERNRFAGLIKRQSAMSCGAVAFITYTPHSTGGKSGAIQCVYATPSDATHPTQWKMKRTTSSVYNSLRPVGGAPIIVPSGSEHIDYDVTFVPKSPDVFHGNPALVRVFRDQMATVSIYYTPEGHKRPAAANP